MREQNRERPTSTHAAAAHALTLSLAPSATLAAISCCLHLLAALCITVAALSPPVQVLLLTAVAVSLVHERAAATAPGRARSVALVCASGDGEWWLVRRDGSVARVRLADAACVHPLLVVATFVDQAGARERIVVVPDMADADGLRELRVLLRTARP